ncbi:rhodanese-like domain-containing protein [Tenacibaculum crassostreae]|uniref:rhodanese-like domain-containing protein n=1 Tax=Tenacibaculum crassostreae TaxID=502683 RepID=UPI0038933A1D
MKKGILLVSLILTVVFSCKPQTNEAKDITVEDLKVILDNESSIQLLDVRTPSEWAEGVITTPIKIDITAEGFEDKAIEKLDKSQPVYIYCRSGGRSKRATDLLVKKGFEAYNVLGGYMEWEQKNK